MPRVALTESARSCTIPRRRPRSGRSLSSRGIRTLLRTPERAAFISGLSERTEGPRRSASWRARRRRRSLEPSRRSRDLRVRDRARPRRSYPRQSMELEPKAEGGALLHQLQKAFRTGADRADLPQAFLSGEAARGESGAELIPGSPTRARRGPDAHSPDAPAHAGTPGYPRPGPQRSRSERGGSMTKGSSTRDTDGVARRLGSLQARC